jgi:hypothetical protein
MPRAHCEWSACLQSTSRQMANSSCAGATLTGDARAVSVILSFALVRAIWPLPAGDQSSIMPLALLVVSVLMLTVGVGAALWPALRARSS